MNNRRLLIAAVFHFVHPVGKRQLKTSQDDSKICQLQLSVNKFPDAAENFPHELTCQILTNQSIKIGRRA